MGLQRLYAELKRRRVTRVIGVYAVAAWVTIEVSATVFPLLQLPDWTATLIVVLAMLGFPVTFALAWTFDITADGVRRTLPVVDAAETAAVASSASQASYSLPARAAGFFGLGILVALVAFAAYSRYHPTESTMAQGTMAGIQSIAVLPFVDMSEARNQEYFSDGVTEELLNRLVQIEGLRVAARTSSFAFKGRNEDVSEIGRKLRVQAVLEGSVRRDGNRVRVTAQLIDSRTGYHLWSDTYERELASIFTIQDEISNAIVAALQMQFSPQPVASSGTRSVRAHDLYLLGLSRWHYRTDASLRQAIEYFERAIAEDPQYALAHAGLAQAYAVLPAVGDFPFGEAVEKGTAAAARALSLDAHLAEAHAALGQIAQNFEWELGDAERAYRRAVEFKPGYATAHQWYAETLLLLGRRAEARLAIDRALELDPLSPAALNIRGYVLLVSRDTAAALGAFRDLTTRYPDDRVGQMNLALAALAARDYDTALTASSQASADTAITRVLANAAHALRAPAPAEVAAVTQAVDGVLSPALAALWIAALGDRATALQRIDQAFSDHQDANLPLILVHPLFDALHTNARFREIAQAMGVVAE